MSEENKIRTLGFYQPFGSLMLHGKIETRWIQDGKKPPFPTGKYLFYTTKTPCGNVDLFDWCGVRLLNSINETLKDEPTRNLNGYAIALGDLDETYWMRGQDEGQSFVKFVHRKTVARKKEAETLAVKYLQWCLLFKNIQRIDPFEWKFGKQGVGFVPESEIDKIKIISK